MSKALSEFDKQENAIVAFAIYIDLWAQQYMVFSQIKMHRVWF